MSEEETKDVKEGNGFIANDKPASVSVTYPCVIPLDEEMEADASLTITLPMCTLEKTKEIISTSPESTENPSDELKRWLGYFEEAAEKFMNGGSFSNSLKRDNSDWRQGVMIDGKEELRINALNKKLSLGGNTLSGDSALAMINTALNIGTSVKVPLWHSGLWLYMKAPSAATMMTIDRLMASEKIILGRQTNGMVFSNVSVYIRKTLIELAIDCVVSTSVEDCKKEDLKELILILDYQTILWAIACSNYPNGYRISQPCISKIDTCNFVTEEKVLLSKLSWTDNTALTDEQKKFMREQQTKKVKKEEVLGYQTDLIKEEEIFINENLSLTIYPPTLKQDIDEGIRWVDSLVAKVDELFSTVKLTEDLRNIRILEQSKATALRQYSSWFKMISLKGKDSDNSIIVDRKTIESSCDSLASNNKFCKIIFEKIGEYIDKTTISLIGIPSYNCPKCGEPQAESNTAHPEIIPLSMDDIFFTLIRQLIDQIISQENTF